MPLPCRLFSAENLGQLGPHELAARLTLAKLPRAHGPLTHAETLGQLLAGEAEREAGGLDLGVYG